MLYRSVRLRGSRNGPDIARPTVASHTADPFGHSGTQGSLFSSPISGFDAVFVSRADYQEIAQRTANQSLEYIWQPSTSLGAEGSTFFGIMNSGLHLYFPLPGLCWDAINCNDPVVQDNPELEDYNVADVVSRAIFQFQQQAENYIGGDVWFTAGFDFNFEFAEEVSDAEAARGSCCYGGHTPRLFSGSSI